MTLLTLPLRYARAKWLRTGLLTAVFTLGVASMTGLWQVSALIGDSFERKLISYGANILVTPKRDTLQVSYGGYSLGDVTLEEHWIDLPEALAGIEAMPLRANVAVVAPKLLGVTRLAGQAVAVVGVDWEQELALKGYWEAEGDLPSGQNDLLAGSTLAARLGLRPGQTLAIDGRDFRVSGLLLPTGSDDDTVLFAPLAFVQEFTGKRDQAAFLEVAALCAGCPIEEIVEQLQAALPGTEVRALRQVAESRMYAVHFAQNLAFSVSLVILVTACAMIIMSMLSAVAERRKEIGIMRAVGFSRASVFAVFLTEALAIGLPSGAIGYAAGHVLARYVLEQLHLEDVAAVDFSLMLCLAAALAAALTAGLAATFPAWKASRVEPAEALVAL
ncbi:MAG: FtsX-like permease family protein [Desulfovibrionaceae bacterium]|nr:FtsX-like permease family protein [Desulfovibrionaceae bacterium]